jgi:ABC-type polysaccharide/polyol phosphate transport system ATPase subunit
MAQVHVRNVSAHYQLMSVLDYNLKHRVVQTVRRRFAEPEVITALRGVDLTLSEGARVGLIGANGAGKSTLLAVMAGLLPPTSGSVLVKGRVLALLGASGAGLSQEGTGRDNIISLGVHLGESPRAMRSRVDEITDFSGLGERILHPVYSYSTGMQSRLRFSVLTSLRPDVLLLDEGLGTADAEFTRKAGQRLDEFISSAGVLVLASHGAGLVKQQCNEAVWLHQGLVAGTGAVDDVLAGYHASYSVTEAS